MTVNDSTEDKALEEYLHRKSALSLGYKKVYVEAPPPELDRAIAARARRALRWIVPGILSIVIGVTIVASINMGVAGWMRAMVAAERNVNKIKQEQKEQAERELAKQPVTVIIDARDIAKEEEKRYQEYERKQKIEQAAQAEWLNKIEALRSAGKQAEADAELKKFQAAYPDTVKK
jgi:hypothetical protein